MKGKGPRIEVSRNHLCLVSVCTSLFCAGLPRLSTIGIYILHRLHSIAVTLFYYILCACHVENLLKADQLHSFKKICILSENVIFHELRNFRYCSNEVKRSLFKSFCTNMYCCPLWINSTSSSVKKLKCSYNSVLRRLLCIRMPYSASAMFVTHGIPSFYELLRKCIYNFSERICSSSNSIIKSCLSPIIFFSHP